MLHSIVRSLRLVSRILTISNKILGALLIWLSVSKRADFCVGYLNLRGWQAVDDLVQPWNPQDGQVCRVLVGMQRPAHNEIRSLYDHASDEGLVGRRRQCAEDAICCALARANRLGDSNGARRGRSAPPGSTTAQRTSGGAFPPYPLHAKLYLLFRDDVNNPITGFVGSSNLTLAGLSKHGELNVDVLDHSGTQHLSKSFDARWADRWALDVSADLATIIESSWARKGRFSVPRL